MRRLAWFAVVLSVVVLGPARSASAHAEMLSSTPVDLSVVDRALQEVTLQFSETVTVRPDGIRVVDGEGNRVDAGRANADGAIATSPLEGSIEDGGYLVAWRATSADGHPVRGAFSFSVGSRTEVNAGLADQVFSGSADVRDEALGAVLRAVAAIGILGASGLVLVGAGLRRRGEPGPVGRWARALAGVGLVAVAAQLPVQASLATGRGLGAIFEDGVLALALADGFGWSAAVSIVGLVAVLITAGLAFERLARRCALVGAVAAPLGLVVTGHTRTMSPVLLGYGADAAHVAAGAVWFGGLLALVAVVRRRRGMGDVQGAGDAVARFSGWAAVAAGTVVVAGSIMGWIEVGGLGALTGTAYGRLLMVKVAVVALVVAGAAWNRYRLVPLLARTSAAAGGVDLTGGLDQRSEVDQERVNQPDPSSQPDPDDRGDHRALAMLGRVVRLEIGALVVVLAITGLLVNAVPAKTAAGGGIQTASAPLANGTVEVIMDPARPGRNDIHVYVLDERGAPDDTYQSATFSLSMPSQDIGPLEREPVQAGPGHFQVIGTDLSLAGEWQLTVSVQADRFSEESATVDLRVG